MDIYIYYLFMYRTRGAKGTYMTKMIVYVINCHILLLLTEQNCNIGIVCIYFHRGDQPRERMLSKSDIFVFIEKFNILVDHSPDRSLILGSLYLICTVNLKINFKILFHLQYQIPPFSTSFV